MSSAIAAALIMPLNEQEKRMRVMRELIQKNNVTNWVNTFMDTLKKSKKATAVLYKQKYLSNRLKDHMRKRYANAGKTIVAAGL